MDGAAFGIIVLVLVNIGAVAYSYGKLSQKVSDACRRLDSLEKRNDPRSCEAKNNGE